MIESDSNTPPIGPSLPLPRVRASGLGCRGGGDVVDEVRRWCDVGDEINAGEGDVYDAEDVQPSRFLPLLSYHNVMKLRPIASTTGLTEVGASIVLERLAVR